MAVSVHRELQALQQQYAALKPRELPSGKPVWIFGAGHFGSALCQALQKEGYQVAGFVETSPTDPEVMGLPVFDWAKWASAHASAPICLGIFNRDIPVDQLEALTRRAGAQEVFMPWELYPILKGQLGWRFWLSEPEVILDHTDALAATLNLMGDVISKRCILDIAAFRLGVKNSYGSFQHKENQYFNQLSLSSLYGKALSFVDGGAYNGDTYLELCGIMNIDTAYLFEPDLANFNQLTRNVEPTGRKTQCLPLGLSDSYGMISFDAGAGEGAAISDKGTSMIAVASLDDALAGHHVDFIKLDVEGAEMKALKGSQKLIKRSRPVLALSLYHRPQDLWTLPLALLEMCENYRFYVRQHHYNSFDSVLYAVPSDR